MQYAAPENIEEASELLASARGETRILAGGTDLLPEWQRSGNQPRLLVDIKRIPQTRTIERQKDRLLIGAAVSGAEAAECQALQQQWPGVLESLRLIGSAQIQSRASFGGNLCSASSAADTVPALIAANAWCRVAGPAGEREIAAEELITGPGETCLAADEFLIALALPIRMSGSGDAYLRFTPRSAMDRAVAGAGVSLTLDAQGRCSAARVALGAVTPIPVRVEQAERTLVGHHPVEALDELAAAARQACHPISDMRGTAELRNTVAGVLVCRATRIACERAGGTGS